MSNAPQYDHYDYAAWGFKAGLEVHQQLNTPTKLFCRCPAQYRNDAPDAHIVRHMRPTLSEMGEYDGTALMEKKTKKNVVYELFHDTVCTYEMDDTPPFMIDQTALDYAIEIALAFNCSLVDELHITRKQYLDGSIPTGFQRTAIVGIDGWTPVDGHKAHVIQLAIEEDACRQMSNKGHDIVFRTDRLSIPLIEVVTEPAAKHPLDLVNLGWGIARILRSTGKVRRGIGSVRQDVNVSITGGTRVEIKGVPRISQFPVLAHYEAVRQKCLLDLKLEMERRNLSKADFPEIADHVDVSAWARPLNIKTLQAALDAGGKVAAIALPGMRGIMSWPTGPGRDFAWEISGRLKVIACLTERPNLLLDEDGNLYGFSEEARNTLRKLAGAGENDAVIVTWGPEADLITAAKEIRNRCADATLGIPSETRQHQPDGTTDFERILPGADRMYPDTDLPPVVISRERRERITALLPIPPLEREKRWQDAGLDEELVRDMFNSPQVMQDLLDEGLAVPAKQPGALAHFLSSELKAARRAGRNVTGLDVSGLRDLTKAFAGGELAKEGLREGLSLLLDGGIGKLKAYLESDPPPIASDPEGWAKRELNRMREKNPTMKPAAYLAKVMEVLLSAGQGKVDGARLSEALRVELGEEI